MALANGSRRGCFFNCRVNPSLDAALPSSTVGWVDRFWPGLPRSVAQPSHHRLWPAKLTGSHATDIVLFTLTVTRVFNSISSWFTFKLWATNNTHNPGPTHLYSAKNTCADVYIQMAYNLLSNPYVQFLLNVSNYPQVMFSHSPLQASPMLHIFCLKVQVLQPSPFRS